MLHIVWLIVYTITAFSNPPTKNQALDTVLGVSDPEELHRMAKNPQQYCKERKKTLFKKGHLKSHGDLIHLFTQQTKQRCQDLIKEFSPQKEWFCNLDVFEKTLEVSKMPDPLFRTASYYALLCDHLLYLTTHEAKGCECTQIQSEDGFKKHLAKTPVHYSKKYYDFLHDHMLWSFTKNGLFSMLDYLIVLGENFHLGSAVEGAKARDDFSTHIGAFSAHSGSLRHDVDHAFDASTLFESFQQYGLNVGTYTQECLAERNTHNILEFVQKVLITFINLHEFTPTRLSSMKESLLPTIDYLPDSGLRGIIPFFMDASADIDEMPDQAQGTSRSDMLQALYTWRERYLGKVNNAYIKKAQTAAFKKKQRKT